MKPENDWRFWRWHFEMPFLGKRDPSILWSNFRSLEDQIDKSVAWIWRGTKPSTKPMIPLKHVQVMWPVDSPHKGPVLLQAFPCHDVILILTIDVQKLAGRECCRRADRWLVWRSYRHRLPFHQVLRPMVRTLQTSGADMEAARRDPGGQQGNLHRPGNEGLLPLVNIDCLTHWGWDKMDAIFQMRFSNAFPWMKMYEFLLRFHCSLFLRGQLTMFPHWFR